MSAEVKAKLCSAGCEPAHVEALPGGFLEKVTELIAKYKQYEPQILAAVKVLLPLILSGNVSVFSWISAVEELLKIFIPQVA